nr:phage tail protein [Marinicella sp. W31]MDC2876563.1 phage tail protein [Marinicella sp. W31]
MRALLADHGFTDCDTALLSGDLVGYQQADISSARDLIEPLLSLYAADSIERAGRLTFRSRNRTSLPPRTIEVLAERDDSAGLWRETRRHDSDLAGETSITYFDPATDYEQASARSGRALEANDRVLRYGLPAVLPEATALELARILLRENRVALREISFELSPQEQSLEVGDVIRLPDGPAGRFMVTRAEVAETIRFEARSFIASGGGGVRAQTRQGAGDLASAGFAPRVVFMDLARDGSGAAESFARVAVFARPWRRCVIASSATGEGFQPSAIIERPAGTARLAAALSPGNIGRFDFTDELVIDLDFGGLSSASMPAVLSGANRIAVSANNDVFEIIGFLEATEISSGRWRLAGLAARAERH